MWARRLPSHSAWSDVLLLSLCRYFLGFYFGFFGFLVVLSCMSACLYFFVNKFYFVLYYISQKNYVRIAYFTHAAGIILCLGTTCRVPESTTNANRCVLASQ